MYEREDGLAIEESENMTIGEPRSQIIMVTRILMMHRWSKLIVMVKLILRKQMVRRSNEVYQDGLRNVNSMIFNSQVDLLKSEIWLKKYIH